MKLGIQSRLDWWLAVVILLITCATFASHKYIGTILQDRINAELAANGKLEASRVEEALEDLRSQVSQLVVSVDFSQSSSLPSALGDETGAGWPLEHLQNQMLKHSRSVAGSVKALTILDEKSNVLSQSDLVAQSQISDALVAKAVLSNEAVFGDAFRVDEGDDRFLIVAPVVESDRSAARAVAFEMELQPVISSVLRYLDYEKSNETHLVQATADGDALFISPLKFAENTAFEKIVSKAENLPVTRAFDSAEAETFTAIDYRGVMAIFALEKIEGIGWGLVTKVDHAEASALANRVQRIVVSIGALGVFFTSLGWFLFLRPVGHRLKSISLAAERVAAGDYQSPIMDSRDDEIGHIARSVDTLASALDEDIAKRALVEDKLLYSATHDELTQLHNRKYAQQQIANLAIEGAADTHSVLFLDLDGFKAINDTYGHRAGDEILIAISQRLKRALDKDAILARWGGDEFVVILPNMQRTYAEKVSNRITRLFVEKFKTSIGFHSLGCSIGIACSGEKISLEAALQEADARMYKEKQVRKRNGMNEPISSILGSALEEDRVEVWYQPILSLTNNDELLLSGAEVLARIRNPDGSISSPGEFLFEIEGQTYGKALDERVMQIALSNLKKWQNSGTVNGAFQLSLNMSEHAINDEKFIENFLAAIEENNVSQHQVAVEIPQNTNYIEMTQLDLLRNSGVKIALDDIGVHHSNLSRLAELEPEIAKIDKSWLNEAGTLNVETADIVLKNLINMCSELGSSVVVEGIESKQQVMRLEAFGVKHFQGYHLGKPLPEGSFVLEWGSGRVASLGFKKAS